MEKVGHLYLPDLEYLAQRGNVKVNDEAYVGKLVVGDTLTVNGRHYAVMQINEDGVVVKGLKQ